MKKLLRNFGCFLLAFVLAFSGVQVTADTTAQAAPKVKKITVKAGSKTLYVKGPKALKTTKLKLTIKPAKASKKVKYVSSKPKVASVNKNGKVTAKKVGKTTITVTAKDGSKKKGTIKITVKKYVYPKSITVKAAKTTLSNGQTVTLKTTFNPKKPTDKTLTYTSSNKALATVSKKGVVTANNKGKEGKVTITVKANAKTAKKKTLSKKITFTIKKVKVSSIKFSVPTKNVWMNGDSATGTSTLTVKFTPENAFNKKVTYTSSNPEVATVSADGTITGKLLGQTTITAKSAEGPTATCVVTVRRNTSGVGIHDPSIYRDPLSGFYYSYGSHLVAAKSANLLGWSWIASSGVGYGDSNKLFTKNYKQEFAEAYAFTMPSGANENAWAPDVVYNPVMKKYCMYMSIVDGSKKCCIALATSSSPEGPFAYQGMLVCSGITTSDISKTNVAEALGITETAAATSPYATMGTNSPDCIDATVFFDHEDNMWMVYGSFTTAGGIRLLKLDPTTGLRGENYPDGGTTATALADSDPYYGLKIANNNGEGPFIQEIKDSSSPTGYYYYLWTSVGGLQSYGGYNMRMVRATDVEGPYTDPKGNLATTPAARTETGLRVIDNYKFSFMNVAYTSCGGNSATDDGNGKTFLHFHQKFANGTEGFEIRTHQTFVNEDGWLVTAPFEYNGETIADSYDKSAVVGSYEFIYHRTTYARTGTDAYDYVASQRLELNEDGTVSGAYTGTWTLNGHYVTITINGKEYKGVVLEQCEQTNEREKTMVFTAIGNDNRTIWGSKMHKTDAESTEYDASQITVAAKADEDFTLPTEGLFASSISWASSNTNVITISGGNATVTAPDVATTVTLTATVTKGASTVKKTFNVTVAAYEIVLPSMIRENTTINLPKTTPLGTAITWTSSNSSVINASTGAVVVPTDSLVEVTMTAKYGTITKTFKVRAGNLTLTSIYSQDYENATIAGAGWTTHGALSSAISTSGDNSYAEFTSTGSGPRSGMQNLGIDAANLTSTYVVSTDFKATVASYSGSGIPTTQIALIAQENTTSATSNALASGGCIVDLQAYGHGVQAFTVNGSEETADIPAGTWCHLEVTVDKAAKQAIVMITNNDTGEELYSGAVTFTGEGNVKGFYILNGRGGTNVQFDNVDVSVTE